jgi:hypothetical protein
MCSSALRQGMTGQPNFVLPLHQKASHQQRRTWQHEQSEGAQVGIGHGRPVVDKASASVTNITTSTSTSEEMLIFLSIGAMFVLIHRSQEKRARAAPTAQTVVWALRSFPKA